MKAGFAPIGSPGNGLGPFYNIFQESANLSTVSDLSGIDAVILWGGEDISPSLYNEIPITRSGPPVPSNRDIFEWSLIREASKKGIPIIGVCRGAQLLCAYEEGKLVQDVGGHHGGHEITTSTGEKFHVTSCHHQMLVPWDTEHELIAWSSTHLSKYYLPETCKEYESLQKEEDKEPEVVYFPDIKGYAIQCHPEWHARGDAFNTWVMDDIINRCYKA